MLSFEMNVKFYGDFFSLPQQFQNAVCVNVAWTILFILFVLIHEVELWKPNSPRNGENYKKVKMVKGFFLFFIIIFFFLLDLKYGRNTFYSQTVVLFYYN